MASELGSGCRRSVEWKGSPTRALTRTQISAALVHAFSWHLWPRKPASPPAWASLYSDLDVEPSPCVISVEVSYSHKAFICLHGWLY